ncbi:MAG: hypothetical protein FWD49_06240 [Firmicutes bacterium]|nr:hypothetical protein [Bacillota bacterium]
MDTETNLTELNNQSPESVQAPTAEVQAESAESPKVIEKEIFHVEVLPVFYKEEFKVYKKAEEPAVEEVKQELEVNEDDLDGDKHHVSQDLKEFRELEAWVFKAKALREPGFVQIFKDTEGKFRVKYSDYKGHFFAYSVPHNEKTILKAKDKIKGIILDAPSHPVTPNYPKILLYEPKFELYRDTYYLYRFRLVNTNGDAVLFSRGFTHVEECTKAILVLKNVCINHE